MKANGIHERYAYLICKKQAIEFSPYLAVEIVIETTVEKFPIFGGPSRLVESTGIDPGISPKNRKDDCSESRKEGSIPKWRFARSIASTKHVQTLKPKK